MDQLSLGIFALVAFTYFGGSYVPNVLKSNKQMLLGVVVGLVLGSSLGVAPLVEGNGGAPLIDPRTVQALKGFLPDSFWDLLDDDNK